jgi:hypothetical protein
VHAISLKTTVSGIESIIRPDKTGVSSYYFNSVDLLGPDQAASAAKQKQELPGTIQRVALPRRQDRDWHHAAFQFYRCDLAT